MPALLGDLGDWAAMSRRHAARLLATLLMLAEDKNTMHLRALLSTLVKTVNDEEADISDLVRPRVGLISGLRAADGVRFLALQSAWLIRRPGPPVSPDCALCRDAGPLRRRGHVGSHDASRSYGRRCPHQRLCACVY